MGVRKTLSRPTKRTVLAEYCYGRGFRVWKEYFNIYIYIYIYIFKQYKQTNKKLFPPPPPLRRSFALKSDDEEKKSDAAAKKAHTTTRDARRSNQVEGGRMRGVGGGTPGLHRVERERFTRGSIRERCRLTMIRISPRRHSPHTSFRVGRQAITHYNYNRIYRGIRSSRKSWQLHTSNRHEINMLYSFEQIIRDRDDGNDDNKRLTQ
eukprot:gene12760-8699_t